LLHPNTIGNTNKTLSQTIVPPGEKICEYKRTCKTTGRTGSYEIYQSSFETPGMRELHTKMQVFLLFYIEASSFIDSNDKIWELLTVYERVGQHVYFLGYTTLYRWVVLPSLRKRLRVSQFMLLPLYQKQGHGSRLYEQVMLLADKRDYIEVNIEDPSPGFQYMRDLFDMRRCREHGFYQADGKSGNDIPMCLRQWDDAYAKNVASKLRITTQQVRRCYEAFRLSVTDRDDAEAYKSYRLDVKGRLYKYYQEELSVLTSTPQLKKQKLQEKYAMAEKNYSELLQSLSRM
jgi:histone acetyltransferase 1